MTRSFEVRQLSSIMYAFMASLARLGARGPSTDDERAVRAALEHNHLLESSGQEITDVVIVDSFAVATLSGGGRASYTVLRQWHSEWEIVMGTIKECIRDDLLISYGMPKLAAEEVMRIVRQKTR